MRARMAIVASGITVELREVVLRNKPEAMIALSPKATVPVLLTSKGEVIDESYDIMLWALHQSDPDNWLLKNDPTKFNAMQQLIKHCDVDFKPQLDRYKYFERYPEYSQAEYREQACVFLAELEQRLSTQVFLMGDHFCLADAAIFPFMRQFANVDKQWFAQTAYTHLQHWLTQCINSPLFTAVMVKYSQWREGDDVVLLTLLR
jgi:glutathione S-transferase